MEIVRTGERSTGGLVMGAGSNQTADGAGAGSPAPFMMAAIECWQPDPKSPGGSMFAWREEFKHNAVQNTARATLLNTWFGATTTIVANTWYLALHSLTNTTNSTLALAGLTASEVGGYATSRPLIAFHSTNTTLSDSTSVSYGFTTSTFTVQGAALVAATNAAASATAATSGGLLYSEGAFQAGSRQVQSGDTLNVTVTVSFG